MELLEYLLTRFQIYLLAVVRIGGLIATAPPFSYRNVPVQIKVGLALILGLIVLPMLSTDPAAMPKDAVSYLVLLTRETIVGLLMGYVLLLFFMGVQFSGQLVGLQMGFGIVNVLDPMSSTQISIIGEFQYLIAMLLFLAVRAHHLLIEVLVGTFKWIPVGGVRLPASLGEGLIRISAQVFVTAIKLGAPMIVTLFLTSVALGIVARTVPQMNVFIVGFPLKIAIGLLMLGVSFPFFYYVFGRLLTGVWSDLEGIVGALSP
ncbi:MAG: flagellar type III secretion system protein FliR [Candidatus Latescibacteria bacterium]|nr:flagellar type III secretion system protein FliR [Candidatus Latescibacterota bacterium]